MYVSNEGSNTVSVVSGALTAGTVSVGPAPLQGAYDPYGGLFYVPDSGANEISVLSGASLDANIQTQASPLTPAFDPLNGYTYVPNNGGCDIAGNDNGTPCGMTVSVISGVSAIANITVGTAPMEPVVDTNVNSPYYGFVYVPNAVSQTISVISGKNNTVVATIGSGPTFPVLVPRPPGGGVYDTMDDTIYMGSYVIQGIDVVGELPTLTIPGLAVTAAGQFAVSCDARCVYDPYNGFVYEPSDPYQPQFQGFILVNGTNATPFTNCSCGDGAVLNPRNGWVYMGAPVISGDTPFALAAPISGALYGSQSFNPDDGYIYGASGQSVVRIGNFCPPVGGGDYNYSALDLQLCNKGGSGITSTATNVTATTVGGVNGSGSHLFTIVTSGNIPMAAGNWIASGSKVVGQAGGAMISFSLSGESGTSGTATITILKSEIVFLLAATALGGLGNLPTSRSIASWQPQLFIDGQQVTETTITQDSTYVYVTFPIHFSTHQIEMRWIPSALAAGTNGTAVSTNSTTLNQSSSSAISFSTLGSSQSITSGSSSASSNSSIADSNVGVLAVSMGVITLAFVITTTRGRIANRKRVNQRKKTMQPLLV